MFLGTGSDVGKSVLTAALCRILLQDGYRVAPFKAQNMALNSFVTPEGGEIGRSQAVQAQAARTEPHVHMNPILLKPTSDTGCQVIVRGKPVANMGVDEYFGYKKEHAIQMVRESYQALAREFDVIVIEGAGSPAEINIAENDIVNFRTAEMANAPVVLIGDIDRGGVFASLYGTLELIRPDERKQVRAMLINKFRGEKKLLDSGLEMMEDRCRIPFAGVVPWFTDIRIPDEDSVALKKRAVHPDPEEDKIRIEVIGLDRISNFTDFDALESEPDVSLYYSKEPGPREIPPDAIILPGSKNTLGDLCSLKQAGFTEYIQNEAEKGTEIIGICAGYQMLGCSISDPQQVESDTGTTSGLRLLPVTTCLQPEKTLKQVRATDSKNGQEIIGYEIHAGETVLTEKCEPRFRFSDHTTDGAQKKNVWGTYIHGVFDSDGFRRFFLNQLRKKRNLPLLKHGYTRQDQDRQYDRLADHVRSHLNMDLICKLIFS